MSGQASGEKLLLLSRTLSPPGVRMGSRGKEQRAGLGLPRTGGLSCLGWKPTAPGCGGWPTGSGGESLLRVDTDWSLSRVPSKLFKTEVPPKRAQFYFLLYLGRGEGLSVWKRNS